MIPETATAIILILFYLILGQMKPGIAIVTCPVVCGLTFFCAIVIDSPAYGLFSLTLLVLTMGSVAISRRSPDAGEWPQALAKWILGGLVAGLALVLSIALAQVSVLGVFLGIIFILMIVVGIGVSISFALTARHGNAAYVLSTLGAIMRQKLPMTMAIDAAVGGNGGKRARILRGINRWLMQGYPLSEAIRLGYRACPSRPLAMITAAEAMNQLPQALDNIEADMLALTQQRHRLKPVHPAYPIILITAVTLIITGLAIYVFPMLRQVLMELGNGRPMPLPTRIVFNTYAWLFRGPGVVFVFLAVMVLLAAIALWIHTRLRPRQPRKPYLISRIGDWIKWRLPLMHWFERNYSLAQTTQILKLSLNAGLPVDKAIRNTLEADVNGCFRKRLVRWLSDVESGVDISKSAARNNLGSPLAWAFDNQTNGGNTETILGTLEAFYRTNYSFKANVARFIFWPCVTIGMGIMVGFVVFSIYTPMIVVIRHLVEIATP